MIGYRYWREHDGKLSSPLAGDLLPGDGRLVSDGGHGVSFYSTDVDLIRALALLDLDPFEYPTSVGTVTGPVNTDPKEQTYKVNGWPMVLPDAMVCGAYEVDRVLTRDPWTRNRIRQQYPNLRVEYQPFQQ